jgi:hypothetical protein
LSARSIEEERERGVYSVERETEREREKFT